MTFLKKKGRTPINSNQINKKNDSCDLLLSTISKLPLDIKKNIFSLLVFDTSTIVFPHDLHLYDIGRYNNSRRL